MNKKLIYDHLMGDNFLKDKMIEPGINQLEFNLYLACVEKNTEKINFILAKIVAENGFSQKQISLFMRGRTFYCIETLNYYWNVCKVVGIIYFKITHKEDYENIRQNRDYQTYYDYENSKMNKYKCYFDGYDVQIFGLIRPEEIKKINRENLVNLLKIQLPMDILSVIYQFEKFV